MKSEEIVELLDMSFDFLKVLRMEDSFLVGKIFLEQFVLLVKFVLDLLESVPLVVNFVLSLTNLVVNLAFVGSHFFVGFFVKFFFILFVSLSPLSEEFLSLIFLALSVLLILLQLFQNLSFLVVL